MNQVKWMKMSWYFLTEIVGYFPDFGKNHTAVFNFPKIPHPVLCANRNKTCTATAVIISLHACRFNTVFIADGEHIKINSQRDCNIKNML